MSHEMLISKKAMFHKNCKVHLRLKDETWENGWIEDVGADFLIFKFTDEGASKRGITSKVFFFIEIKDIDEYEVKG